MRECRASSEAPLGDARVAGAFGHQGEHLALPRRQGIEWITPSARPYEFLHQGRVHHLYKKPTALVVVDELPRSAARKVLKHELRSKYG